jgi:hypothetical protein
MRDELLKGLFDDGELLNAALPFRPQIQIGRSDSGCCGRARHELRLFAFSVLMRVPQAHPGPATILVDEFDAGSFQSAANRQVVGRGH